MTLLGIVLVLISFLAGIGAVILLVLSLIKGNVLRRQRSLRAVLTSVIVFIAGGVIVALTADTTAPEITVSEATLEYSQTLSVNEIAAVTDDKDENVAVMISSVTPRTAEVSEDLLSVDFENPGDYTITVVATDQSNNEALAEVVVHVVDTTSPVFTDFSAEIEVDYGTSVKISNTDNSTDAIYAVAEDEVSEVTYSIIEVQPVSLNLTEESFSFDTDSVKFFEIRSYTVTVAAEDDYGNAVSEIVQVSVVDEIKPVFSGVKSEYTLSEYDEAPDYMNGVTATDEIDGDLTEKITLDALNVSYGVPGDYTVVYSVADNSGNIAEKSVAVTIKDTTAPTVTLSKTSFSITVGDDAPDYSDIVSVSDAVDGNLTESVEIDDSAVDYSTPGTYEITYSIADNSGNKASKTATVTVKSKSTTSTQSSSDSSGDGGTVYITKTGAKYHTASCRYLKKSKIPISKSSAIAQGYEPCSVCNP